MEEKIKERYNRTRGQVGVFHVTNEADGAPGGGGGVERHFEVPLQSRDLALNDVGNIALVVVFVLVILLLLHFPLFRQRRQRDLGPVDGLD